MAALPVPLEGSVQSAVAFVSVLPEMQSIIFRRHTPSTETESTKYALGKSRCFRCILTVFVTPSARRPGRWFPTCSWSFVEMPYLLLFRNQS